MAVSAGPAERLHKGSGTVFGGRLREDKTGEHRLQSLGDRALDGGLAQVHGCGWLRCRTGWQGPAAAATAAATDDLW